MCGLQVAASGPTGLVELMGAQLAAGFPLGLAPHDLSQALQNPMATSLPFLPLGPFGQFALQTSQPISVPQDHAGVIDASLKAVTEADSQSHNSPQQVGEVSDKSPSAPAPADQSEASNQSSSQQADVAASSTNATGIATSTHIEPYLSAHQNYNSYAHFPWQPPQPGNGALEEDKDGKKVFSKESLLESELQHLRSALSEKTKEVQRLSQELEKAYELIETYQKGKKDKE